MARQGSAHLGVCLILQVWPSRVGQVGLAGVPEKLGGGACLLLKGKGHKVEGALGVTLGWGVTPSLGWGQLTRVRPGEEGLTVHGL